MSKGTISSTVAGSASVMRLLSVKGKGYRSETDLCCWLMRHDCGTGEAFQKCMDNARLDDVLNLLQPELLSTPSVSSSMSREILRPNELRGMGSSSVFEKV